MADKPWYQDKEALEAGLAQHATWVELGRVTGIPPTTLKSWGSRLGVKPALPSKRMAPMVGESVSREELLAQENAELRRQVAAARKLEVFDERALQLLQGQIEAAECSYETPAVTGDKQLTTHRHVLMYSDLHAAERVSYEAMSGLNEYNWDIMLDRHQTLTKAVLSFKQNRPYPIDELLILGLGDMVTGDIHDELRETNEEVISEAAVRLGMDMAAFIAGLAPHYSKVRVVSIVGNHGRLTRKPEFKNSTKSWDWIAYKIAELRLAEYPNISVEVPRSFEAVATVFDQNILCFHGDGIPTNMPGIPWGGVQRRTKELFDTWMAKGTYINHFALGHFHEANVVGQKRIWVNGSIKGPDEYSIKRFGGGRPPCQLLHTFHPERGLVGTDYLML